MQVDLDAIVDEHIRAFSVSRRQAIEKVKLQTLLTKKNPYLFIARQTKSPDELARELVTASLSSSEETMFGNTLESIAIGLCGATYGGQKSAATGVDLEFNRDDIRYIVSIKSGPNWGNSRQIKRMRQDLNNACMLVRQNNPRANVMAVNGCCYGVCDKDYGDYRKVCGAAFWELIAGEPDLHVRMIKPLRRSASNGFNLQRTELVERIASELKQSWCTPQGDLDWERIVNLAAGHR